MQAKDIWNNVSKTYKKGIPNGICSIGNATNVNGANDPYVTYSHRVS